MKNKKVVVIGGGHGLSTILRGIKTIEHIDISAIVTVADDGGSTGRLRNYFNIPAMGDIRSVMIALADSEPLLKTLMEYRFEGDQEQDVIGHNLGNLILTALTQTSGSFIESIQTISKVLNVKGDIIPSSNEVITLYALMEDNTIVKGEANIPNMNNRIKKVYYDCKVNATSKAILAIQQADLIIYGIGSVYTSIMPNIIIEDIKEALKKSKAYKVYFCNAMSQPGETDGYSVEDHVQAILDHGGVLDSVVIHNDVIPTYLLEKYQKQGSQEVKVKKNQHDYELLSFNLLSFQNDYVRHDSLKLKKCVEALLRRVD